VSALFLIYGIILSSVRFSEHILLHDRRLRADFTPEKGAMPRSFLIRKSIIPMKDTAIMAGLNIQSTRGIKR
jgi:hypothetical protein